MICNHCIHIREVVLKKSLWQINSHKSITGCRLLAVSLQRLFLAYENQTWLSLQLQVYRGQRSHHTNLKSFGRKKTEETKINFFIFIILIQIKFSGMECTIHETLQNTCVKNSCNQEKNTCYWRDVTRNTSWEGFSAPSFEIRLILL